MILLKRKLVISFFYLLLFLSNQTDGQLLSEVVSAGLDFMSILPDTNFTNVVIFFTKTDPNDTGNQSALIILHILSSFRYINFIDAL